jgi:hypothetical protein
VSNDWEYVQGATLPDAVVDWYDEADQLIPFGSVPHTFQLKVAAELAVPAVLTKATGMTGQDLSPNLRVQWSTGGEITTLAPGLWVVQIKATRTADGKARFAPRFLTLRVHPAIS